MNKHLVALAAMGLLTLLSVGCCPLTKLNVTVELDDAMKQRLAELNRNIVVDLVAVNPADNQRWEDYSMTKYWQPPFELRESVKGDIYTMTFDASKGSLVLPKNDPKWDKWLADANAKGAAHLYILAQLPGTFDDQPGEKD